MKTESEKTNKGSGSSDLEEHGCEVPGVGGSSPSRTTSSCYCVCHSPLSSNAFCEHCEDFWSWVAILTLFLSIDDAEVSAIGRETISPSLENYSRK